MGLVVSLLLCVQLLAPSAIVKAGQTLYNNATGTEGGYSYELWKDYGTTSMTLNGGGNFSCSWSNIGNALFRKGVKWDCTQTYQQLGNISIDFGCNYQPNGNSYLCVYGWTRNPLVEYYIVESWGSWRPPGSSPKGQITVDGGTYDVYETTRYNQPSIDGDTTFQQYWSVRTSKRTSGTISVSQHFSKWESMGMRMGKMYEAALNVEGYQSSGSADVYKNDIHVGGNGGGGGYNPQPTQDYGDGGDIATGNGSKMECEDMTISGQYAGKIDSPFSGVALYANDDVCKFTQNFSSSTSDFTLRGCSNNDNMARVDLIIGGQTKGTFYYGDANPAEYTIKNVSHGTGNQVVELKVTADDGSWDAYVDSLTFTGGASSQSNPTQNPTSQPTSQPTQAPASSGSKLQCESGTLSGPYAGGLSSPFEGVALYGNDDTCSFNYNFTNASDDFTLRGCSNNNNMARVDLIIDGQTKGTFYYGDANPAEFTIKDVYHGTGNKKVELKVTADNGQWDAYLDYLQIGDGSSDVGGGGSYVQPTVAPTQNVVPSGKMVALTFDDGPSSTTNDVLDVLQRYDAVATFFLIGQNISSSTRATMQRQVNMGCELACHSQTHSDMGSMGAWQVQNEISQCVNAIKGQVNTDVKFFRAPYLSTSNTMFQNIDLAFIQGITCNDWESYVSAEQRKNTVLSSVSDGTIILLHDFQGNSNTVQALPGIIEGLRNQGYTFVTVSDLFKYKGVNPNQRGKVWSNVFR